MRAKSTLRLLPVLALTYAAGWFSRRGPAPVPVKASQNPAALATASNSSSMAGIPAVAAAPGPGGRIAEIRPLTLLQEVLGLIGVLDRDGGELAILPLMDLLPRLMITDAATVRRLLEEIAADTTLDRNADFFPVATGGLVFRWMLLQPEEATRFLLQHQKGLGDFADMAPFLIAWADRTRAGAGTRLLAEVPEDDREDMGELLHKQVLMADPAKTLSDPAAQDQLNPTEIGTLITRWWKTDPSALLAWRATLPGGSIRESADSSILNSLDDLKGTPEAAEASLANLPADLADRARLKRQTRELSEYHHVADEPSLPPPDPSALASRLADAGSRQALPYDEMNAAMRAINNAWVGGGQFAEAAKWLGGLPEDQSTSGDYVQNLVTNWAEKDSASASSWINTLPVGKLRDQAAGQLVETIQTEDPVNALVWAKSIGGSQDRQDAISGVYRAWFEHDPAAASQAVQSLSPVEVESLKQEKRPSSSRSDAQTISVNAIDALIEGMDNLSRARVQTPPGSLE